MVAGSPSAQMATEGARARLAAGGLSLGRQIVRDRRMYLFITPGALYSIVFQSLPLLGNIIAFND